MNIQSETVASVSRGRFLDDAGIAQILNVKPRTIRLWRSKRQIPYFKVGKIVFMDPAKVLAAINRFELKAISR